MLRHFTALPLALTLATATVLPTTALAFPGNNQAFDCYRKSDNSYSFGSPTDVSNTAILCTPNPDLGSNPVLESSVSSNQGSQPSVSSNSGANIAAGLAIGLGAAALGRAIFDDDDDTVRVYSPGYGRGYPYNGYNYYRRGNNYYYHNRGGYTPDVRRGGTVRQGVTR